jgi:hypothetical protein
MPFIKAKNGTVVEVDDNDLVFAVRALQDGHEVFVSDPRKGGSKPKSWKPDAEAPADSDSE